MMLTKERSRSAVKKGPERSPSYLARVRAEPCLICGMRPVHAHHVRLGLRTMGKRVSDFRAVPLCERHHTDLHSGSEDAFWKAYATDPTEWMANFQGKAAA